MALPDDVVLGYMSMDQKEEYVEEDITSGRVKQCFMTVNGKPRAIITQILPDAWDIEKIEAIWLGPPELHPEKLYEDLSKL